MKINEAALKKLLEEKKNTEQTTPTPKPTSTLGMSEAEYNDFINKTFSNVHNPEIPQAMLTPTPTPTPEKTYMGLTESEYADAVKGILDNMPVRNPFGGFFGQKIQTPRSVSTTSNTTDEQTETVTPITEAKSEINGVPNTISNDAMEYISEQIEALGPQRNTQIGDLINAYINRADFKYDPNADMLFQNYLSAMQNAGQMAMRDTMGQAAMLTGGYGSSYATAAANGAYNSYLQKANEALPDYYNIAANAYDRQGQDMLSQIQLLQNQDDEAYSRWLDQMKLVSGNSSTGEASADTMTATQENAVMSNALNAYKENGGDMSAIDTMLDGMTGYNFSKEFRDQVKNYILSHTSKITKVKDKKLGSDKYTDGKREFTYSTLMDEYGNYFTKEQKQIIKDLSEGRSYVF